MGLEDHFRLEGLAYRLVPIKYEKEVRQQGYLGGVATEIMFENVMNKWEWGNMDDHGAWGVHGREQPPDGYEHATSNVAPCSGI